MTEAAVWKRDSDMVFTAVSTSGARDYKEAGADGRGDLRAEYGR